MSDVQALEEVSRDGVVVVFAMRVGCDQIEASSELELGRGRVRVEGFWRSKQEQL